MPPRRLVMAAAVDEQVEVQLPIHHAGPCWCAYRPSSMARWTRHRRGIVTVGLGSGYTGTVRFWCARPRIAVSSRGPEMTRTANQCEGHRQYDNQLDT